MAKALAKTAFDEIEAVLRRQLPTLEGDSAETLREHLTYIENNQDRMRYATLHELGLPIGSGVTESTAKTGPICAPGAAVNAGASLASAAS